MSDMADDQHAGSTTVVTCSQRPLLAIQLHDCGNCPTGHPRPASREGGPSSGMQQGLGCPQPQLHLHLHLPVPGFGNHAGHWPASEASVSEGHTRGQRVASPAQPSRARSSGLGGTWVGTPVVRYIRQGQPAHPDSSLRPEVMDRARLLLAVTQGLRSNNTSSSTSRRVR